MAGHGGKSLENKKKDNWPQDILLSILTTLPAKSLLRFKCVSKHWQSLIINPDFIEHHLEHQKKKEYPQLILASTDKAEIYLESVAIVDVEGGKEGGARTRKGFERIPLDICHLPRDFYCMSNSCDGVLCFYGRTSVFVYNPGTREFRILQIGKEGSSLGASYSSDCFGHLFLRHQSVGFGRDQVTKECKIIRLFRSDGEQQNHSHECEVFTLSSDAGASWRGIGAVAYIIRAAQQPAYVNGALHWILDDRHANPSEVIVSFDLHTEKFQATSHPSCCSDGYMRRYMGLLSLRSSLCLLVPNYGVHLSVWMMNQSNGIWEKLFSIVNYRTPLAYPMVELRDGTSFVCHCGDKLQIFDPVSETFGEVLLRRTRKIVPSAYSESLVPLYGKPLVY